MVLELLAPARNAEQGILALRCGADAVYMGGPRFGARQGATCGLEDLEAVAREARFWDAKLYLTLNTLLFDGELEEARRMAWRAFEAGVDALILQDLGLLQLDLPPIPRHASTQAVCDRPEKVAFLASAGFSRAILARELSLDEMAAIRKGTDIELEAFVFGALCVGESGQCYLSGALCGRSGNRGECAQPCRSPWMLQDASGRALLSERPLLSIQDLDLSGHLEALADAGICSFKIEGRLKDADYVKNVVGHLRRRLDALLDRRPELGRASLGHTELGFDPEPSKTFNRGLGPYRIDGLRRPMATLDAAGHLGEAVGRVRSVKGDRVLLEAPAELHPGDGLAFLDAAGQVAGTTVNAVEGAQVFVQDPSRLAPGLELRRNLDHRWLKGLRAARVRRRLPVVARLELGEDEVRLRIQDPQGLEGLARRTGPFGAPKDAARTRAALEEAVARLGDTDFVLEGLHVEGERFVPVSVANALRREAAEDLRARRMLPRPKPGPAPVVPAGLEGRCLDFTWNVANAAARTLYTRAGAEVREPAAECGVDLKGRVVMRTRHCLRYELGWCAAHPNPRPLAALREPSGPLFLVNGATRLRCVFDCAACRMQLVLEG